MRNTPGSSISQTPTKRREPTLNLRKIVSATASTSVNTRTRSTRCGETKNAASSLIAWPGNRFADVMDPEPGDQRDDRDTDTRGQIGFDVQAGGSQSLRCMADQGRDVIGDRRHRQPLHRRLP